MTIERQIALDQEIKHGQVRVFHGSEVFNLMFGPNDEGDYVAQSANTGELVLLVTEARDGD